MGHPVLSQLFYQSRRQIWDTRTQICRLPFRLLAWLVAGHVCYSSFVRGIGENMKYDYALNGGQSRPRTEAVSIRNHAACRIATQLFAAASLFSFGYFNLYLLWESWEIWNVFNHVPVWVDVEAGGAAAETGDGLGQRHYRHEPFFHNAYALLKIEGLCYVWRLSFTITIDASSAQQCNRNRKWRSPNLAVMPSPLPIC